VRPQELHNDRERLTKLRNEAQRYEAGVKARLQTIEAAASRHANAAETEIALQRLEATQSNVPLGLEAVQIEQETRRDIQRELHE
jgi:hypothetical protein